MIFQRACLVLAFLVVALPPMRAQDATANDAPGILDVEVCETEHISPGLIYLSTYGADVLAIDEHCNIASTQVFPGPVGVYVPSATDAGLGIVNAVPFIMVDGDVLTEAETLMDNLDGYIHHDLVETAWGTYMTILAERNPANRDVQDDVLVEFNEAGEILSRLSLNEFFYGDKWGAACLADNCEAWLHINSLDTRAPNRVLVGTRNLNKVVEIDWEDQTTTMEVAAGQIGLAHHAQYYGDDAILIYDNNVPDGPTQIEIFDYDSNLLASYDLPFYSPALGSVQRLDNGNWLVIDGIDSTIYKFNADFSEVYLKVVHQREQWNNFREQYDTIIYRATKVPHPAG